jgi:hypothetical protein
MKVLIRTWCKALGVLLVIMAITTFGRASKAPAEAHRAYRPYGTALELMAARDQVVMLSGPAGTGKSRACLEKMYIAAMRYDGMRGIFIRKTRASMTQSAMATFERQVLPMGSAVWFHTSDQEYRFPNGSIIAVAGMDKPSKIQSSDWDIAYVQEATELNEEDLEYLDIRMRWGVMPYQQVIGDCNPGPPNHWLKKRGDRKALRMLETRHQDNPVLWDRIRGDWTPKGRDYITRLERLTGARRLRLLKGQWAAAEGMVYDMWDPRIHLIDAQTRPDLYDLTGDIPRIKLPEDWQRYRVIDFGYTHPFVCQWWAADPDGRLYLYRELYGTQRITEDWARDICELSEGETYQASIADHDADDRATLDRHGVPTFRATKPVSPGIQAVQARLRPAGDGRPRLFIMRDCIVSRDPLLEESRLPACTAEEFDGYVWARVSATGTALKEVPVKKDDHGMDTMRYMVAHLDNVPQVTSEVRLF